MLNVPDRETETERDCDRQTDRHREKMLGWLGGGGGVE